MLTLEFGAGGKSIFRPWRIIFGADGKFRFRSWRTISLFGPGGFGPHGPTHNTERKHLYIHRKENEGGTKTSVHSPQGKREI
ncbi:hypothetical protein J6590_090074, partial [Homalodisca vitripennis]